VDVVEIFSQRRTSDVAIVGLIDFVFECDYRAHVVLVQNLTQKE